MFASGSADSTIRIWNKENGQVLKVLNGHSNWVLSLKMLSNGNLVSGSMDKTIRVWDLKNYETLKILEGHSDGIFSLCEISDKRLGLFSYKIIL